MTCAKKFLHQRAFRGHTHIAFSDHQPVVGAGVF